jgi:hypothetical protein
VIAAFRNEFGSSVDVKKPDIAAAIEHTKAFKDNGARLKKMATEAAIMIAQKKGVLKQMVVSDLDIRIREENDRMKLELKPMLEAIAKKAAEDTMKKMNGGGSKGGTREPSPEPGGRSGPTLLSSVHAKKAAEIKNELSRMASSGVVSMLKSQFKIGSELPIAFSAPPPALIEKKDEDDESEIVVPPDSITLDISGSPPPPVTDVSGTVIVGLSNEPRTIVHM